jgi:Flp pilus assembly protein TadG
MTLFFRLFARSRRFARREDGTVLIDSAFALTVLALFIVGIADLGLGYMRQMTMMNAVRAGSQLALVRTPSLDVSADSEAAVTSISEIRAAVLNAAPFLAEDPGQDYLSVSLNCTCPDGTATQCFVESGTPPACSDRHAFVNVSLTFEHEYILPYPGLGESLTLSASNSVRVK